LGGTRAALLKNVRSAVLAFAFATLITATASAQEEIDAATVSDAEPGPRLPNGEPTPAPDLVTDTGGISCRMASSVATCAVPGAVGLALLGLLARRRR
jgi:MYXO-CTERM domain-containing protein